MVQHVFHCDNYFHSYGNFNVFDNDNANVGNLCLWLPPLIITQFQLNIPELLYKYRSTATAVVNHAGIMTFY